MQQQSNVDKEFMLINIAVVNVGDGVYEPSRTMMGMGSLRK